MTSTGKAEMTGTARLRMTFLRCEDPNLRSLGLWLCDDADRLRARNEKLAGAGRAVLQKLRDWQAARKDEGPHQSPSYHEFIWLVERIETLGAALEDGE